MKIFLLYTDPGSGVMLLQILLAFVASGLFYFRNTIKSIFRMSSSVDGIENNAEVDLTDDQEKSSDDHA